MAIKYAAEAPKENQAVILKTGEYPFEITDAKETVTEKDGPKLKAGTPKIELKIRVNDEATVYDNLFFSPSTNWKVDALLKSLGQHPGEGVVVEINAFDLVGEKGTARIKTGKTQAGQQRNEVDSYTWEKF